MTVCPVVKKMWEMLRSAKSDRFLHCGTLNASAASPGPGKGLAGSGSQTFQYRSLCSWRVTQVQFSLKTWGKSYLTLVCCTVYKQFLEVQTFFFLTTKIINIHSRKFDS